MFSYLSRGYGTWEGIAKLETPDSAISRNQENYLLPPIQEKYHFYDHQFGHDGLYKFPLEKLKLPEVPKSPLHVPKTYSTKRGALLLYSEGCFVPGSRRLKKRPRFSRQKQRRLQTMKDLMQLIMDYKKNGCDPLLLEQLWRRMSNSARDVQPGYSPKRYLSHLGQTAFDSDSWKKLVETGSLRSFGDDGFLPSLLPDHIDELNHRPQPYKTMSLPPVSPSSSMLGSFTFYKNALSTGAASMVSLPSVNSETVDELSARSACTFVESLADRLAEVESESGFKQDYDALSAKEKEDLLTQLLMEVTLHGQGDVITIPTQDMAKSSTINTDTFYLIDDTESKSVESLQSYHSVKPLPSEDSDKTKSINSAKSSKSLTSGKSSRSSLRAKSFDSSKSVKSVQSSGMPVCSLPPIVSKESVPDSAGFEDVERKAKASLSSSGSGLSLVVDTFALGLNGIDIEIEDDSFYLEDTDVGLERKYSSEARSLRSERTISEYSLIDALDIQDGESLHWLKDETLSLRSFGSADGVVQKTGGIDERASSGGFADGDIVKDMVHGDDGVSGGVIGGGGDAGVLRDGAITDVHDTSDENDGDVVSLRIGGDKEEFYPDDNSGDLESTKQMPKNDLVPVPGQQTPHISLTSLQNEVRLVAEEVLSRPTSGRILAEDAEIATFLLMERMEALLGPALTDNVRIRSAAPNKVRPLGQPRNSEIKEKRRIRSAGASLASRSAVKSEEKQAEEITSEGKELHVEVDAGSLSKSDEKDRSVDDVNITVGTVEETKLIKETTTQSPQEASATPSPEGEFLTVKDSQPEVEQVEETKHDTTTVKKRKEGVPKEVKVKKGVASKRGSVAKSKKKKTSTARARNEPPKATPFRVGLVPESKPPKGLEQKSGGNRKKGNGKQTSPDLQESPEKAEPKTEPDRTNGLSDEVSPPGIPARVDSETGEIEHGVSPSKKEKSPSLAGSKSPPDEKISVSRDEVVSPRVPTESPREKSPSVHEVTPSPPFDEPSTPRDKTPSSRDKTPSPREPKPCPRDRDAVLREQVSADVEAESVEVVVREPSPEVVLTEKQRRANTRAAQRAAAAERRRLEVERKRREREEARRRAQEEEARLEVLRKESEEEMKKREEERRIQKEQEERERMRVEAEQNERARQERLMIERQRQAREEWKRKKEQLMAQRKFEEELRKERERVEQQVEEERKREYEEKIAHLEEEERERLLEERRLEEERIKREIQEEKERQEEERRRMLEERRKMEEELAVARERQLSRRIFLETLLKDFQNLLLDQRITRAFTFSYFDILPWFKDRWRDLQKDRPLSKRPSTQLDTVPEEPEIDMEHTV